MTHAIRIHEHGGPEVLLWEEVDLGAPGPGEVCLRQTAAGLNFIDVYHRNGAYALPDLPTAIGMEAAGVVEEEPRLVAMMEAQTVELSVPLLSEAAGGSSSSFSPSSSSFPSVPCFV